MNRNIIQNVSIFQGSSLIYIYGLMVKYMVDHNRKKQSILLIFLVMTINLINLSSIELQPTTSLLGTPGDVINDPNIVLSCQDSALEYIDCQGWKNFVPEDNDYDGTIMVFDDGLSIEMWDLLESGDLGFSLDIMGVLSNAPSPETYEAYLYDDPSIYSNEDIRFHPNNWHGFAVLSVIGTVLPHAKIIFVNIQIISNLPDINEGDGIYGLDFGSSALWDWIINNYRTFNIDVISMSFNYQPTTDFTDSYITGLSDEIFLVTSIGNRGENEGSSIPQKYENVYAVGSIDHENRGTSSDPDYYSMKDHYSGSAIGAVCSRDECSFYGDTTLGGATSLDFVMPGNGVPIYDFNAGSWKYGALTSFSTPYLAAAAQIARYAYTEGYASQNGAPPTTVDRFIIYEILKTVADIPSSSDLWNQRYGWGYVDLLDVYNWAYEKEMGDTAGVDGGGTTPPSDCGIPTFCLVP